ncbi:hypothetical protein ACH47V_25465 [Micromonospora chersina]|uniref:hypothetical protein n=1 Tax=Micromonospora chersina TaxID=47854 RepID=UPI0033F03AA4
MFEPGSRSKQVATDRPAGRSLEIVAACRAALANADARHRQINRVLHIMATVQLRNPTEGRAYFDRKKASGRTSMEAMRALKRRLSDIIYRRVINDAAAAMATGPGRTPGNDY